MSTNKDIMELKKVYPMATKQELVVLYNLDKQLRELLNGKAICRNRIEEATEELYDIEAQIVEIDRIYRLYTNNIAILAGKTTSPVSDNRILEDETTRI